MLKLKVNRQDYEVEVSPETPLLWVLRETLGLTGTKYRLWHGAVRRVHGPPRRRGRAVVRHPGLARRRQGGHHDRRACRPI